MSHYAQIYMATKMYDNDNGTFSGFETLVSLCLISSCTSVQNSSTSTKVLANMKIQHIG